MSASEEINAKLDWIAGALKYLLQQQAGGERVEPDEDAWLDEGWEPEAPVGEYVVPVHAPKAPKRPSCPHNRQGIDDHGNLICQRCGYRFTSTGSVQNRVGANGGIVRDPNPPEWALQHSPGASSKNPGTPLVPYSD